MTGNSPSSEESTSAAESTLECVVDTMMSREVPSVLFDDERSEAAISLGGGPSLAADGIEQADVGHTRLGGEVPGLAQDRGHGRNLILRSAERMR